LKKKEKEDHDSISLKAACTLRDTSDQTGGDRERRLKSGKPEELDEVEGRTNQKTYFFPESDLRRKESSLKRKRGSRRRSSSIGTLKLNQKKKRLKGRGGEKTAIIG